MVALPGQDYAVTTPPTMRLPPHHSTHPVYTLPRTTTAVLVHTHAHLRARTPAGTCSPRSQLDAAFAAYLPAGLLWFRQLVPFNGWMDGRLHAVV